MRSRGSQLTPRRTEISIRVSTWFGRGFLRDPFAVPQIYFWLLIFCGFDGLSLVLDPSGVIGLYLVAFVLPIMVILGCRRDLRRNRLSDAKPWVVVEPND